MCQDGSIKKAKERFSKGKNIGKNMTTLLNLNVSSKTDFLNSLMEYSYHINFIPLLLLDLKLKSFFLI